MSVARRGSVREGERRRTRGGMGWRFEERMLRVLPPPSKKLSEGQLLHRMRPFRMIVLGWRLHMKDA